MLKPESYTLPALVDLARLGDAESGRGAGEPPRLIDTAREAQRTQQRRAWVELRRCFHDEARIESVAAGGVLDPDRTVVAIAAAFKDGPYSPGEWEFDELAPDVVISWTSVRYRPPGSGTGRTSDSRLYWAMTGRDGLIWRVRVFGDRAEAIAALERYGPDLGI